MLKACDAGFAEGYEPVNAEGYEPVNAEGYEPVNAEGYDVETPEGVGKGRAVGWWATAGPELEHV